MTDDIVKILRDTTRGLRHEDIATAADEIEKLRAQRDSAFYEIEEGHKAQHELMTRVNTLVTELQQERANREDQVRRKQRSQKEINRYREEMRAIVTGLRSEAAECLLSPRDSDRVRHEIANRLETILKQDERATE